MLISNNLMAMSYTPFPKNIGDLVNTSDLIVIATIGEVLDKREFYGYQDDAELLAVKDKEIPIQLGLQIVDFSVKVTEIIQDDKEFPRLGSENSIIIRIFQSHDTLSSSIAVKERSGSMVLFLTRNPDDKTYGLYSAMHKIMFDNLDKEVFYYLNGIDYKVPFIGKIAEVFINEVRDYIDLGKTNPSKNVTGLWQDINNEKTYYSLHQNDNTIIVIDLRSLEFGGDTFSATYIGSVEDYILKPILPGIPINMTFQSDKEAKIIPICDTCSVIITQLKKIF
ncbi:MAG: hypothetical protein QM487_14360 [Candidatus Marithrix sp.]